jgi:hypothetical protein
MMAKQITVDDVVAFVSNPHMSVSDRERVCQALNASRKAAQLVAGAAFVRGDKVTFRASRGTWAGSMIVGTVQRVNRMTVILRSTTGTEWRVSPSMLSRV